jgi:hypothetical protein
VHLIRHQGRPGRSGSQRAIGRGPAHARWRDRSLRELSDDLTNSQIALLCDIGEFHLPKLTSDQKRDLERLISGGYVAPTESHASSVFMLTAKGVEFLGQRGAGLNEA